MYINNNNHIQNLSDYEGGRWAARNNDDIGRTVDNYAALAGANFPLNSLFQQFQQPQSDQPQISMVGRINSGLASLQAAIEALYASGTPAAGGTQQTGNGSSTGSTASNGTGSTTTIQQTITSSNTSAITASATGSATPGTHTISVTQLAKPQVLNSTDYQLTDNTFGGTLTFQTGTGAASTVTITPNSSLSSMVDAINKANVGITASLNYTGIDNRLSLSSTAGGVFSVTGVDSAGSTHLSTLNYSGNGSGATGSGWLSITRGQDAQLSIDGTTVTAPSNTFTTPLIPGVTLNLLNTTLNSPVTINILAPQTITTPVTGTGSSTGGNTNTGGTSTGIGSSGNIFNFNININNFYGLGSGNLSKHYGDDDENNKAIRDIVAGFVQAYNNSVNSIFGTAQIASTAKIGGENGNVVNNIVSNHANPANNAKTAGTASDAASPSNNSGDNGKAGTANISTDHNQAASETITPSGTTSSAASNTVTAAAQETARQIIQNIISGAPTGQATSGVTAPNNAVSKSGGSFTSMADLGVSVNADGKLTLDTAKLNSTLKNNPETFIAALTDFGNTVNAAQQTQNSSTGNSSNNPIKPDTQDNSISQQSNAGISADNATRQQAQLASTAKTLDNVLSKTQQTGAYFSSQLKSFNSGVAIAQNTVTQGSTGNANVNPQNANTQSPSASKAATSASKSAPIIAATDGATASTQQNNGGTPQNTVRNTAAASGQQQTGDNGAGRINAANTTTANSHDTVSTNSSGNATKNTDQKKNASIPFTYLADSQGSAKTGILGTNAASFLG